MTGAPTPLTFRGGAGGGGSPRATGHEESPHPNPSPEGEGLITANIHRGEVALRLAGEVLVLRPSFAALVAAEGEVGPLFSLVERAAEGRLSLGEMVALFWHCLRERPVGLTRDAFGEAVADAGLSAAMPVLRVVLQQILSGK